MSADKEASHFVHFSSKTDLWSTPQDLFDRLNAEHGFTLDVCALPENAKCENYYTPEMDGLSCNWHGVIWCNPPYGNPQYVCKQNCKKKKCLKRGFHNTTYKAGIKDWVRKAYETSLMDWQHTGHKVVMLLPARTDTAWWHNYVMRGDVTFIRGRLKFGGHKNSAPFPSAIVVFKPCKSS